MIIQQLIVFFLLLIICPERSEGQYMSMRYEKNSGHVIILRFSVRSCDLQPIKTPILELRSLWTLTTVPVS